MCIRDRPISVLQANGGLLDDAVVEFAYQPLAGRELKDYVASQVGGGGESSYVASKSDSTTTNAWTEIDRITVGASEQLSGKFVAQAARTDSDGAFSRRVSVLMTNYGAAAVDDSVDSTQRNGDLGLSARARASGSDVIFEVRGRNGQNWDWEFNIWVAA